MHVPVLLKEVIQYLDPQPGQSYIDATLGSAGHAAAIVERGGMVLGLDRDAEAIVRLETKSKHQNTKGKLVLTAGNFSELQRIARDAGFGEVSGIIFDLGLSSSQLDEPERGFAFQRNGPLDMRFDRRQELTAHRIINFYPEKDLADIFFRYGEEKRFGRRTARAILERRKIQNLETTGELFELIKQILPGSLRFRAGDTARRIFQSLRIVVNEELANLEKALPQAVQLLRPGGKLLAISFHSLEDRIVKEFFVRSTKACICPPQFPVCVCGSNHETLKILTKKPVTAGAEETKTNPRAHSAKLRVAERIASSVSQLDS